MISRATRTARDRRCEREDGEDGGKRRERGGRGRLRARDGSSRAVLNVVRSSVRSLGCNVLVRHWLDDHHPDITPGSVRPSRLCRLRERARPPTSYRKPRREEQTLPENKPNLPERTSSHLSDHITSWIVSKSSCASLSIVLSRSLHHASRNLSHMIRNHGLHRSPLLGPIISRNSSRFTNFT